MEASGIRVQERQMEMKVWLPPQAQKGPGYAVKQVVGVLALVGLGLAAGSWRHSAGPVFSLAGADCRVFWMCGGHGALHLGRGLPGAKRPGAMR